MDTAMTDFPGSLELGDLQVFENMGVVPLSFPLKKRPGLPDPEGGPGAGGPQGSRGGRGRKRPRAQGVEPGGEAGAALDGEELSGVRQNRVQNTTILVPARSRLVIPVSCTEAGRWSYEPRHFEDSDNVLAHPERSLKTFTATESLQALGEFSFDQGLVWEEIDRLAQRAGSPPPPGPCACLRGQWK